MNKKVLIIVAVAVIIVIAAVAYFLAKPKDAGVAPGSENNSAETGNAYAPSEKPDEAKFNEYFKSIYIGKIAVGEELAAGIVPELSFVFVPGKDQYCTVLQVKKALPTGAYASAIYNTETKKYIKEKTVFGGMFSLGTNAGCGSLPASVGKYEYKAYINNALVAVMPFEIAASAPKLPGASAPDTNVSNNTADQTVSKTPSLTFSASGCDATLGLDPYAEPFSGVLSKKWVSGVYQVEGYVKTLCEGINITGNQTLSGTAISLRYSLSHGQLAPSDCYCTHKLTYKISNLDQKEYVVSLSQTE